jgi:hypothetical protein
MPGSVASGTHGTNVCGLFLGGGEGVVEVRDLIFRAPKFFFYKTLPFMRKCRRKTVDGQATEDNMARGHCMLDT